MKEYLDSLTRLEALPPDTLVLPSHGLPFRGLHTRLAQLREHHLARLDDVASVITGKTNAFAIAQEVFARVLYANPRQAFGESLAHLNMLASLGRLTREVDAVRRDQLRTGVDVPLEPNPPPLTRRPACSARKGGRSR